jgi:hypothetical protein
MPRFNGRDALRFTDPCWASIARFNCHALQSAGKRVFGEHASGRSSAFVFDFKQRE